MKRLSQSRLAHVPAVSLYRDDVEEIAEILGSLGSRVSYSNGTYQFDSLEELIAQTGTSPSTLEVSSTSSPMVSVKLTRMSVGGCHVYSGGSDAADAAFLRIRDVLSKRRTVLSRVFQPGLWMVILGMSIVVGMLSTQLPMPTRLLIDRAAAYSLGMSFTFAVLSWFVSSGFLSRVTLSRKHEVTTLWSRNGEKLIIGLVSALAGALLKTVVDSLSR